MSVIQVRQLDVNQCRVEAAIARVSLNGDVASCVDGITVSFFERLFLAQNLNRRTDKMLHHCIHRAHLKMETLRLRLVSLKRSLNFRTLQAEVKYLLSEKKMNTSSLLVMLLLMSYEKNSTLRHTKTIR